MSIVRPVVEYVWDVWHTNLPTYLTDNIEMIQKGALRCVYPGKNYEHLFGVIRVNHLGTQTVCHLSSIF